MSKLKHIGFFYRGRQLLLLILFALPDAGAQDLVSYPFSKSRLSLQQAPLDRTKASAYINPLQKAYDVKYYGLDVKADNRSDKIHGSVTILVQVSGGPLDTLVFDLHQALSLYRVEVDGEETEFTHPGDELYIALPDSRDSGSYISAQIFYGGQTGDGMLMETDEEWGVPVTYTSSEPFYSRDWFPCKQDLTDKADSVHVFITTDYHLMGVSNGIHTGTTYYPNGKVRYQWKSNYPIDYYLISLAVADYAEYNLEVQPAGLEAPIFIQNFIYDVPSCLDTYRDQIDATLPIMEVFCAYFGPYPHRAEKYGHYLWPRGGGMEHQTMTGMGNFEFYLVAHELGHSWFGNHVTCATWQDIWINEGFATFAGYLATEMLAPEYADGEREYRFNRALLEPGGTVYVPAEDAENDSRIFSGNLSYNKGMALLYMIRFELQDDALFYHSLRNFLDRYAGDVATGLDFKEVLEETSGVDFTDFFNQWYFGAGYPIYEVDWEQQGSTLTLRSTQRTSSAATPLFRMSMEYTMTHAGGDTTVRVMHDEQVEHYVFDLPYEVTGILVDPDNHVLDGPINELKRAGSGEVPPLFTIAPNPSQGTFFFALNIEPGDEGGEWADIEVLDLGGKIIYRNKLRGCVPFMAYRIDLPGHVAGLYLVRCRTQQGIEVQKILVK